MQDETKAREVLREITGGEHTLVGRDEAVAAMLAFQSEARAVPPDGEREDAQVAMAMILDAETLVDAQSVAATFLGGRS